MFEEKLQERLNLLEKNLVSVSKQQLRLVEKKTAGNAELMLELRNVCILFQDLENKKLGYFKNKKCADYLMYEKRQDTWIVHIFELKRSIGEAEWGNIKEQFKGAMQNALAIAGLLGIEVDIDNIYLYSAFRNDKLNDFSNPARLRYQMHEHRASMLPEEYRDWNEEEIMLEFLKKKKFIHKKIQLDIETGIGRYKVS